MSLLLGRGLSDDYVVILYSLRSLLLFYTQCVIILCFKFWLDQFEINLEISRQVLVLSVLAPMALATTSMFASMIFFQEHNFSFWSCLSCPLTQHQFNFRDFLRIIMLQIKFLLPCWIKCLFAFRGGNTLSSRRHSTILCELSVWWWNRILRKWFKVTLEILLVWSEFSKHCYSSSCKHTPHADMSNYKNIYSPHKNHFADLFGLKIAWKWGLQLQDLTSVFLLATMAALSLTGIGFALRAKIKSLWHPGYLERP